MRRGDAPVLVGGETCVLGHAWQDGLVLCPVCGFGRRTAPADDGAEAMTVTAVVAMPAARDGEVTSASVSPDGHWAWNGEQWVASAMSTLGQAPAAHAQVDEVAEAGAVAAGHVALVPAEAAAVETEDTGTWAAGAPVPLEPAHVPARTPAQDHPEPASIPLPSDASATVQPVADTAAARAAERHEEQTLQDLARLLALADVPDDLSDTTPDTAGDTAADTAADTEADFAIDTGVDTAPETTAETVFAADTAAAGPADDGPAGPEALDVVPLDTAPEDVPAELAAPVATGPSITSIASIPTAEPIAITHPAGPADLTDVAAPTVAADAGGATEAAEAAESEADQVALDTGTVTETETDTENEDAENEDVERSRRTGRLGEIHLSPNGLRAAVVVLAAVVSTVIATGHSPIAHHASSAPAVDTLLQETLRSAAVLETRYAGEHGHASLSAATLRPGGYRAPSLVHLTVTRTTGKGFCLVGSGPVAGPGAYELWDPARGGLVTAGTRAVSYPSIAAARVACPGAGAFAAL